MILFEIFIQIAFLHACSIFMLREKLTFDVRYRAPALTIENGNKALICFEEDDPHTYCDIFDGKSITPTYSSVYPHQGGDLAFFKDYPTAVGSSVVKGRNKVETLYEDGWYSLPDQPR